MTDRRAYHGDRSATPKPIEELIAEHALEIEEPVGGDELLLDNEAEWVQPNATPDQQPDFAVQWRQWAVTVASTSFGSTGARTNEELVDRSVAILQYITNGKP